MTLATEKCDQLCARLKDLDKKRSAIEDRRAATERLGVNNPEQDALDAEQLRDLDAQIVQVKQRIATLECNCNDDDDAGGSSPVLHPAFPGPNP